MYFYPETPCPKCRWAGVTALYHQAPERPCPDGVIAVNPEPHLHRCCTRCGYDWTQTPLDHPGAPMGQQLAPGTDVPDAFVPPAFRDTIERALDADQEPPTEA